VEIRIIRKTTSLSIEEKTQRRRSKKKDIKMDIRRERRTSNHGQTGNRSRALRLS